MRRRKEKKKPSETLATQKDGDGDDVAACGFFACYLLTSLSPRHKGHTYIGFTVNPKRRIRQHNGEIGCGAFRTKRKRPWEMVMCIYGFPTNVSALQFEWAWQHPKESLAVRKAAAELKCLTGVANKIKLAYTMLTLPSWQSLNLTVNFFSTKYTTHCASCTSLPDHMKVQVHSMDDLPCYDASSNCSYEDEYDFCSGDEFNHPGCPADIVPEELNATGGNSSYDHGNEKDENGVLSDFGQENWPSSDVSDAHGRPLQLRNEFIRDCSSPDERQTLETDASSQQLSTEDKYWSLLDETSTWGSHACAQQPNLFSLHGLPSSKSTTLSGRHDSVIYVSDQGTIRSNGMNSLPASRVIVSSAEAEVIDLMTPSPDCRARILSKKKSDPSIIDLTRSPNFIQL